MVNRLVSVLQVRAMQKQGDLRTSLKEILPIIGVSSSMKNTTNNDLCLLFFVKNSVGKPSDNRSAMWPIRNLIACGNPLDLLESCC